MDPRNTTSTSERHSMLRCTLIVLSSCLHHTTLSGNVRTEWGFNTRDRPPAPSTCCRCCAYPTPVATLWARYIPYSTARLYTHPVHRYSTCYSYPTGNIHTPPYRYAIGSTTHPTSTVTLLALRIPYPIATLPVPDHTGDTTTHLLRQFSRMVSSRHRGRRPGYAERCILGKFPSISFQNAPFRLRAPLALEKSWPEKTSSVVCCHVTPPV